MPASRGLSSWMLLGSRDRLAVFMLQLNADRGVILAAAIVNVVERATPRATGTLLHDDNAIKQDS